MIIQWHFLFSVTTKLQHNVTSFFGSLQLSSCSWVMSLIFYWWNRHGRKEPINKSLISPFRLRDDRSLSRLYLLILSCVILIESNLLRHLEFFVWIKFSFLRYIRLKWRFVLSGVVTSFLFLASVYFQFKIQLDLLIIWSINYKFVNLQFLHLS